MNDNFSILINTTDSFEDCWIPFFTLFKKFWPDYTGKIYLNTETKVFTFPDLDIVSVQNNKNTPTKRITWSECLLRALKSIDSDIILYMQEDYFLKDTVKNDLVDKYVQMMHENKDIHCIHLTDQAVIPEKNPSNYDGLFPVILKQRYRISCQAALWRKDVLLSYLRSYENAWQFEEFGSQRAAILKHNFYVVDKNWVKLNQFEIIPYVFTGIIQGKWKEEVVPLFDKNEIRIDYKIRGFIKNSPKRTLKMKLKKRIGRIQILWYHFWDILSLKQVNDLN
jgi:hypothetical protein